MHIIRTWEQLAEWLERPTNPDIAALLKLRRDQLIDCGDLTEIGTFAIVQSGDTSGDIVMALGFQVTVDGTPTWEWVARHGAIWEAPFILSDDGFGHVLIVPDAEGIDPQLLALCRANA